MRYLTMLLLALSLSISAPAQADEPAPDAGAASVVTETPDVVEEAAPAPVAPDVVETADVPEVVAGAPEVVETPAAVTPAEPAETPTPTVVDTTVPETDADAGVLIGKLLDAAVNGHWTIFAGMLLLLLMWFFNRMGLASKVGRDYVPWVTVGVGAVGFVAIGLATGANVLDALKAGLLEGGVAIALWELVFKRFTTHRTDGTLRKEPEAPEAPEATPAS